MLTVRESAVFSEQIYRTAGRVLPSGWVPLGGPKDFLRLGPSDVRANGETLSGFYAEAYRNRATGEVAVVFRGTQGVRPTDWKENLTWVAPRIFWTHIWSQSESDRRCP